MIIATIVFGNIWQVFLNQLFREYWQKHQGPWLTTKLYNLNRLLSNLRDSLTKMESSTTMTGYWHMASGGGTFLLLPFKFIFTTTQNLCWRAHCKRNGRYSSYFLDVKVTLSEQLWLNFTSILATFNIGKARDNSGKEIPISDEYEDLGFILWAAYSALASMALTCIISPATRNILSVQSNPGLANTSN